MVKTHVRSVILQDLQFKWTLFSLGRGDTEITQPHLVCLFWFISYYIYYYMYIIVKHVKKKIEQSKTKKQNWTVSNIFYSVRLIEKKSF